MTAAMLSMNNARDNPRLPSDRLAERNAYLAGMEGFPTLRVTRSPIPYLCSGPSRFVFRLTGMSTRDHRHRLVTGALRVTDHPALAASALERTLLARFVEGKLTIGQVLDLLTRAEADNALKRAYSPGDRHGAGNGAEG